MNSINMITLTTRMFLHYMSSFKEHEKITEVLRDRFARYSTSNYKMDN
jgi:hypothetical protein